MDVTDTEEAIRVEELECRYGDNLILRDISFRVRRNEIFFIAGRSGSGKSTLLRHLVGLQTPAHGRIEYFGRNLAGAEPLERLEFFKLFGVLFQEHALWTDMSLAENIGSAGLAHANAEADAGRSRRIQAGSSRPLRVTRTTFHTS